MPDKSNLLAYLKQLEDQNELWFKAEQDKYAKGYPDIAPNATPSGRKACVERWMEKVINAHYHKQKTIKQIRGWVNDNL